MKEILKQSAKLFLSLLFVGFLSIILVLSFSALTVKSPAWLFYLLSQSFSGIILVLFVSAKIYPIGFKDSNTVRIGNMKENIYKGFLIGIFSQIPAIILLICSIIYNYKFALYRLLNAEYFWILSAIAGNSQKMQMAPLKLIMIFLVLFIVPVISGISYVLGYKGINLSEKLIYKKREDD